jgi:hypothetical protein
MKACRLARFSVRLVSTIHSRARHGRLLQRKLSSRQCDDRMSCMRNRRTCATTARRWRCRLLMGSGEHMHGAGWQAGGPQHYATRCRRPTARRRIGMILASASRMRVIVRRWQGDACKATKSRSSQVRQLSFQPKPRRAPTSCRLELPLFQAHPFHS